MKKAFLNISIEKIEEGAFKDDFGCSGCEVEALGMIAKARMVLTKIERSVKDSIDKMENKND